MGILKEKPPLCVVWNGTTTHRETGYSSPRSEYRITESKQEAYELHFGHMQVSCMALH